MPLTLKIIRGKDIIIPPVFHKIFWGIPEELKTSSEIIPWQSFWEPIHKNNGDLFFQNTYGTEKEFDKFGKLLLTEQNICISTKNVCLNCSTLRHEKNKFWKLRISFTKRT